MSGVVLEMCVKVMAKLEVMYIYSIMYVYNIIVSQKRNIFKAVLLYFKVN